MSKLSLAAALPFLRGTARTLWMELRGLRLRGPRAVLAAQTVASVLLAYLLANLLHMDDRWWVTISAYVVLRADWETSAQRALQRMAGTIGGALLGALLAIWVLDSVWLFALSLTAIAGIGVYRALGSPRSYGWLLAAISGLLVLSDALHDPAVHWLALQRIADVAVGTVACIAVSGLVHLLRLRLGAKLPAAAPKNGVAPDRRSRPMRRLRAAHAAQGALTIGLLGGAAYYSHFQNFAQMLVTIAVVLVVPLASLQRQEGDQNVVALRMTNRALGCLLAAGCAVLLLPWIGDRPLLLLPTLSLGIWLASHVQSGNPTTSYIGTQFGIAFLVVFVQDQAWSTDLGAASLRLLGIFVGILALGLVMLAAATARGAWRRARRLRQQRRQARRLPGLTDTPAKPAAPPSHRE